MSEIDAKVDALSNKLALMLAGEQTEVVLRSLADGIVATLAFAADDRAQADRFVDKLIGDLRRNLDKHWDHYRAQRSKIALPAGAA